MPSRTQQYMILVSYYGIMYRSILVPLQANVEDSTH